MTKSVRKVRHNVVGALCTALFAMTVSSLGADEIQVEQRAFYVPEVYITDFSPGYCVALVSVLGGEVEARKELFFKLADTTFQKADPENQKYKIAGIDFVEFNSFHLVSTQHCGVEGQFDQAASMLRKMATNCAGDCAALSTDLKVVHGTGLIATLESQNQPSPILIHQARAKGESVANCTIALPTASDAIDDPIWKSISLNIWQYGLPIMDVSPIDEQFFLLVSRDCSQKVVLFELLKEILHRDNAQQINEPNYSPDVTEYVFSQTGK